MRPLPSPPTSATSSLMSLPSVVQSFTMQLPIGVAVGGPRPPKARRREGRIFTHSASSSMSSFDSASGCSIISAEFWMPPQDVITIPMQAAFLTVTPSKDEAPVTTKTKPKFKPANIIIPRTTPIATVVSPTSPSKPPPAPVSFPATAPEPVAIPRTPLSPLSPLSPNRRIQSPNARIRKLAKLTRTLGENVPVELVFPSGNGDTAPVAVSVSSTAPPLSLPKVPKRAQTLPLLDMLRAPTPQLTTIRPRSPTPAPEWPLTPTPDCTVDATAHSKTAVGLHYALGMHALPTHARAVSPIHASPVLPASPPPFTNTFTVDDVAWGRARQAVVGTRAKKPVRRALGGVRKPVADRDNGRGTWRKKENTWSGEWNVEDMEELQVKLRRLR
ncbi:hypothetical protein DFH07DRAFT_1065915 [Mycena maculata]|uniref:Uncharacterized protein n=1 Tax=Mycena maculata TaxID=230809 RepID=A0AAD7HYB1_9AGAR|nr:hypothetical protein DFH07DRAFT_1065915 [Mycena maculata]